MDPWLSPYADWRWQFIPDKQQLILHTKQQTPFVTAFKNKQLMLNTAMEEPFTLEQTAVFHEFADALQPCMACFPEPTLWHICIHAVAARFYHKTVANKSYWFTKNDEQTDSQELSFASGYVGCVSALVAFDAQLGQVSIENHANKTLSINTDFASSSESQTGCGLILSRDGSFATLLLLSPTLDVTSDKTLPRYTALKTHCNTLRDASLEELETLF